MMQTAENLMLGTLRCAVLALLLLLGAGAEAHHSFAVFDQSKTVEIRGVIVEFNFRNPHSSFVIDGVAFLDGVPLGTAVERWEIESDTTAALSTKGVGPDTFKPGEMITLRAAPSRQEGLRFGHATSLTSADGKEFRFGFGGTSRAFSPSVREAFGTAAGEAAASSVPAAPPASVSGYEGIAGRWQQPVTPSGTDSALPLNARGRAARSRFDPKRSPANTCEPMSFPDVFDAPFFLIDIEMTAGEVVIRHEIYDIVRRVPLDGTWADADPDGWFGKVRGSVEGATLVIESRDYPESGWGLGIATHVLGGGADVPSSAEKTLTERYSVSEDGQTLVIEYTLSDPVYLSADYSSRLELTRVPDGTEMYPYECDLESASMWSRTVGDAPPQVDGP
jgi:hypothetical protein